ncbi:ATPase, T2SS/T4P/T4SS family, partial [Paraburkholderia humisilvae]
VRDTMLAHFDTPPSVQKDRCPFSRVNLRSLVLEGTVLIAIRKHLAVDKTLEELDVEGRFRRLHIRTYSDSLKLTPFEERMVTLRDRGEYVSFLKAAVAGKLNIAVAGATGSGKSTFTRTLLKYVPRTDRTMILEDTHEVGSDDHDEIGYSSTANRRGVLPRVTA